MPIAKRDLRKILNELGLQSTYTDLGLLVPIAPGERGSCGKTKSWFRYASHST